MIPYALFTVIIILKTYFTNGNTCTEHNTKGYLNVSEVIGNIYENQDLLTTKS